MTSTFINFGNLLVFKFIKIYVNGKIKFSKFDFTSDYGKYGKYGAYGGNKWSANSDINNNKQPLDDIAYELVEPTDPLDTIFMFHDYKLAMSKGKYYSFKYNIDVVISMMHLSKNYRIINLLTGVVSFPLIVVFSLCCTKHRNFYTDKHMQVLELDDKFRSYLKSYYNCEINYEELEEKSKQIFIEFKQIL